MVCGEEPLWSFFDPCSASPRGDVQTQAIKGGGKEALPSPAERSHGRGFLLRAMEGRLAGEEGGGQRGGCRCRGAMAPQKTTHCARQDEPALWCQPRKQMPSRCLLEMLPPLLLSAFISKPADFLPFLIELKMFQFSRLPPPRASARRL